MGLRVGAINIKTFIGHSQDNIGLVENILPEVIGSHESFVADRADKIFLSCVSSDVPCQLV